MPSAKWDWWTDVSIWVGEHTIYSKKVMAAVLGVATMIFMTQALCAQGNQVVAEDANSVSEESSSSQPNAVFEEDDIDFSSWGASSSVAESQARGGTSAFGLGVYIRMVVVLAIIVVAIILLFRFIKRASIPGTQVDDDTFLRHISGVSLGPNKSVQIVTLVDKAYLLGVSDASVNLIGEVEDKELVNAMNLWSDKKNQTSRPRSFSDVLDIFMPHGPRSERGPSASPNSDIFSSSSSQELLNSLKQQSKRLEGGDDL